MTTPTFGPWTSSLDSGSSAELSAFWKRRLRRLEEVRSIPTGATLRSVVMLLATALAIGLLPVFRGALPSAGVLAAGDDPAPNAAPSGPARPRLAAVREERALRHLDDPVNISVAEAGLAATVRSVADQVPLRVEFDEQSIREDGIKLDIPITLKLEQVPFKTIFTLLLEPQQLDWYIVDDRLIISTRAKVDSRFADWLYDVRDLTAAGLSAEDLSRAIRSVIDRESWAPAGQGTLRIEGGELRIRQTPPALERLRSLLAELRDALRGPRIETEAADRTPVTRTYDIADLRAVDPVEPDAVLMSDEEIAEALRRHVLPTTWRQSDGPAILRATGDRLLVKQTTAGHDAVEDFLRRLRFWLRFNGMQPLEKRTFRMLSSCPTPWLRDDDPLARGCRRALREVLASRHNATFRLVKLEEAVSAIAEASRIHIWIDDADLLEKGLRKDKAVLLLRDQVPLASILDDLLLREGLDWRIEYGSVFVASKEKTAGSLETRVHRTKEVLATGKTEAALVERIRSEIEPASWAEGGTRIIHSLPGFLIVTHNRRVQDRIAALLAELEDGK